MAMNPRDAANAKRFIDSVISFANEAAAPCSRDDDQIHPQCRKRYVPHAPTAIKLPLFEREGATKEALADITQANTCLSAETRFKAAAKRNVN
jgi:hypothetical protein